MSDDKTEEPTAQRLKKAREDGDTGTSVFFSQWVGFLVGVALLPSATLALYTWAKEHALRAITSQISHAASLKISSWEIAFDLLRLTLPLLLAIALAGGATSKLQAGGGISFSPLAFRGERLNPIQGLKSLFSRARLFATVRSLVLAVVIAFLAVRAVRAHLGDLAHGFSDPQAASRWALTRAEELLLRMALIGLFAGIIDVVVVRAGWMKRIRMSRAEVKREHKEQEGDPQLKAARERAHHELLAQAAIGNVRKATVLVVNPTHLASALRYSTDEGDETPLVLASGAGDLARRLIEEAHRYGIPVVRNVPLARALAQLEPGEEIPEALYEAVAIVLEEAWAIVE